LEFHDSISLILKASRLLTRRSVDVQLSRPFVYFGALANACGIPISGRPFYSPLCSVLFRLLSSVGAEPDASVKPLMSRERHRVFRSSRLDPRFTIQPGSRPTLALEIAAQCASCPGRSDFGYVLAIAKENAIALGCHCGLTNHLRLSVRWVPTNNFSRLLPTEKSPEVVIAVDWEVQFFAVTNISNIRKARWSKGQLRRARRISLNPTRSSQQP
jgi:hypothetical protein